MNREKRAGKTTKGGSEKKKKNVKIKQETSKIKNSNRVITENLIGSRLTRQRDADAATSVSPQTASACAAFTDRALIGSLVSSPFLLICSSVVINYHSACWSSNGIRINAGLAVFLSRFIYLVRETLTYLCNKYSALNSFANLQPEESSTTKMNRM